MSNRRCFKRQCLGHIASDHPNRKVITLAEWAVVKKEFEEEEKEDNFKDNLQEIQDKVVKDDDEGEMLVLRRILSN